MALEGRVQTCLRSIAMVTVTYQPGWRWPSELGTSIDRKSTRLNSCHSQISYAVFCLKKKKKNINPNTCRINKQYTYKEYISHTQQAQLYDLPTKYQYPIQHNKTQSRRRMSHNITLT